MANKCKHLKYDKVVKVWVCDNERATWYETGCPLVRDQKSCTFYQAKKADRKPPNHCSNCVYNHTKRKFTCHHSGSHWFEKGCPFDKSDEHLCSLNDGIKKKSELKKKRYGKVQYLVLEDSNVKNPSFSEMQVLGASETKHGADAIIQTDVDMNCPLDSDEDVGEEYFSRYLIVRIEEVVHPSIKVERRISLRREAVYECS